MRQLRVSAGQFLSQGLRDGQKRQALHQGAHDGGRKASGCHLQGLVQRDECFYVVHLVLGSCGKGGTADKAMGKGSGKVMTNFRLWPIPEV